MRKIATVIVYLLFIAGIISAFNKNIYYEVVLFSFSIAIFIAIVHDEIIERLDKKD